MTADVHNRKDIREAFASLLESALVGSGKPAQKVYKFRASDFKGKRSVVCVTSNKSNRSKQAQVTRSFSQVGLEAHTFVLYSAPPVQATNNPTIGSSVVISLEDTTDFDVNDVVTVEDANNSERATVTAKVTNVSITVNALTNNYTTPNVYWWTEQDAEDRLDLLEKSISDVVLDNDTNDTWDQLAFDGDSVPDPVVVGGKAYLHEIFPLRFDLHSG